MGATLGVAMADSSRQVFLLVGDGSFQVTGQELSTMIRNKCWNVNVFLINNQGYTIERVVHDGPFNDIQPWKYHLLPEVFGGEKGFDCQTEEHLEKVLQMKGGDSVRFVEVHFDKLDYSETLRQVGQNMASISR